MSLSGERRNDTRYNFQFVGDMGVDPREFIVFLTTGWSTPSFSFN